MCGSVDACDAVTRGYILKQKANILRVGNAVDFRFIWDVVVVCLGFPFVRRRVQTSHAGSYNIIVLFVFIMRATHGRISGHQWRRTG